MSNLLARLLLRTSIIVAAFFTLLTTRHAPSATIPWVGDQSGELPVHGVASFFHNINWLNFTHPQGDDVGLFGSGYDSTDAPHILYFGDSFIEYLVRSDVYVAGGNADFSSLAVEHGSWTFDFGAFNSPGGNTGNLTLSDWLIVGSDRTHAQGAGNAILTVRGPGALEAVQIVLGDDDANGTLNIRQNATLSGDSTYVGGSSGTGVLNVESGGFLNTESLYVGFYGETTQGTANFRGTGTSAAVGAMFVGGYGTGVLNVEDGANLFTDEFYVGTGPYGTGTVNVSGVGSLLQVNDLVPWFVIGDFGGSGTVNVDLGGSLLGNFIYVGGSSGTGVLNVESGGSLEAEVLYVGYYSDEETQGTANFRGAGTTANLEAVIVGGYGTGVLNVEDGANLFTDEFYVGTGPFGTGTVNVSGVGSLLQVNDLVPWFVIGDDGGSGTVNVNLGGSLLGNSIYVGGSSGTGVLNVESGGSLEAEVLYVGYYSDEETQGTANFRGTGTTANLETVLVGGNGIGVLNVDTGATLVTSELSLGIGSDGPGTVNISGTGSTLEVNDQGPNFVIGAAGGSGTLNVNHGGFLTGNSIYVGGWSAGTGTLNVESGGSLEAGLLSVGRYTDETTQGTANIRGLESSAELEAVYVGGYGTGVLNVENGATLITSHLRVGDGPHGSGNVNVSGTDSLLLVNTRSVIGSLGGAGTLSVSSGGTLMSDFLVEIGGSSGGVGTSVGTLNVENGGHLDVFGLGIGSAGDSEGTVNIRGETTNIEMETVTVGGTGTGTLNIETGAHLAMNSLFVSRGATLMSGSGSYMEVETGFTLGGAGIGSLTVDAGASFKVGDGLYLRAGSSVELLDGGTGAVGTPALPTPVETLHIGNGGLVYGVGDIVGNVLVEGGTLSPGREKGTITITGIYTHQTEGSLEIELGGTAAGTTYDQLLVTGSATLDGSLAVSLIDEFVPTVGNLFELLRADGGIFFEFADVSLPELDGNLDWNVIYSNFSVLLEVVSSALPGDYNGDGLVNTADYVRWRDGLPEPYSPVDAQDYDSWKQNFGIGTAESASSKAVPEPSALLLLGLVAFMGASIARRT